MKAIAYRLDITDLAHSYWVGLLQQEQNESAQPVLRASTREFYGDRSCDKGRQTIVIKLVDLFTVESISRTTPNSLSLLF